MTALAAKSLLSLAHPERRLAKSTSFTQLPVFVPSRGQPPAPQPVFLGYASCQSRLEAPARHSLTKDLENVFRRLISAVSSASRSTPDFG
jgi:hypothetical protein